ncbi:MAG TPA: glycosyltransferase family 1 protein [Anaerolineae bacterium]|nr:glycosyltransferase family 1 protein [Anaerolineae bacterium]
MRVVYSIGARFAGGGIGNTAYRAVQGLYRHDLLGRLLCGSYRATEIPAGKIRSLGLASRGMRKLAVYDPTYWINYYHNVLYDHWAARQLERCDLFHGWNGFCLKSLQRAKNLGAVTVVERASAHNLRQRAILEEEYGRWGRTFPWPQASLERSLKEYEWADYILVPSQFAYDSFLDQGFAPERLLLIPFGVDTERFRPADKSKGERPFRILYVGQISLQKGGIYLLQAWQKLGWTNAELYLVGRVEQNDGRIFQPYQNLPGVHWLGYVSDPVRMYQKADVFVFPSLQEGSALVTYEAMACGLPIITTAHAGSVARDGREGFIVPIRDADALANRLETLRRDKKLRLKMGQAAREHIKTSTWEKYSNSIAQTFASLS